MKYLSAAITCILSVTLLGADVSVADVFDDKPIGLRIHYPGGWYIDRNVEAFRITSYPEQEALPQVIAPADGAVIVLTAPPDRPPPNNIKTVGDWMRFDRASAATGRKVSEAEIKTERLGLIHVSVSRLDPTANLDATQIIYYFEAGGRLLKASLYYRGHNRSEYFEGAVEAVIKNLEPEVSGR
jgi:hypothetical protein